MLKIVRLQTSSVQSYRRSLPVACFYLFFFPFSVDICCIGTVRPRVVPNDNVYYKYRPNKLSVTLNHVK